MAHSRHPQQKLLASLSFYHCLDIFQKAILDFRTNINVNVTQGKDLVPSSFSWIFRSWFC